MSERLSLERLKAMDDDELSNHRANGGFPFEPLPKCGSCLTQHSTLRKMCSKPEHKDLKRESIRIGDGNSGAFLREHLEELYALRLFYDHLYPQPEAQADQLEAMRIEEYDARAGTR